MARWPERTPLGDGTDPRGFEVLIARYLEWRDVHHYSQRARTGCESALRSFGRWCVERGISRPVDVTRGMVERYQRWLYHHRRPNGRPLAVRTQASRLSYLRSFCKWLAKERYILYNPASEIVMPREPVRLPVEGFSVAEVEQVLSSVDVATPLGLRDRAVLEVLYSTGMRRSELAALDLYDLNAEQGVVTIRAGKGGKDRVVPVGERALAWVARYLEDVRPQLVLHADEWALFISADGVRFHPDGLGNRVARILEDSGVRKRFGACHLFRHTLATQMLEGGADIRFIQEMLGHSKLETTQVYTRVSVEKLKEIHTATHPGARLRPREEPGVEASSGGVESTEGVPSDGSQRRRQWVPQRLR